jgi:hypothetical protein
MGTAENPVRTASSVPPEPSSDCKKSVKVDVPLDVHDPELESVAHSNLTFAPPDTALASTDPFNTTDVV